MLDAWLAEGAAQLADTLGAAGPDAEVWTPVPGQASMFYAHRFAHETVIHRADATLAVVALLLVTWLSVAKPWGRLRRERRTARRPRREPDAHPAAWLIALVVPFLDYLLCLQGALMLLTMLGYAAYRQWRARARPSPASPRAVSAGGSFSASAPAAEQAPPGNAPRTHGGR